jgi:hypothetical protein
MEKETTCKTCKDTKKNDTKCEKCNKVKKQITPYVLAGVGFFLLCVYGIYSIVKDLFFQ